MITLTVKTGRKTQQCDTNSCFVQLIYKSSVAAESHIHTTNVWSRAKVLGDIFSSLGNKGLNFELCPVS